MSEFFIIDKDEPINSKSFADYHKARVSVKEEKDRFIKMERQIRALQQAVLAINDKLGIE